jgi:ATP-binding cassette, subfamily B, bacterial PglK
MKTIKNIFSLIEKKRFNIAFFIIFSSIILAFLELIGIAAIPIYLGFLLNPDIFLEKFTFLNFINFKTLEKDSLLIYGSATIICFFVLKNFYSSLNIYLTEKMFMNVRIDTSIKLLKIYLIKNYDFFLNKNSSIIIRNVTNETSLAVSFINSSFQILKEVSVGLVLLSGMIILNPVIMLSILTILILSVYTFNLLTKDRIENMSILGRKFRGKLLKILSEMLNTIKIIKLRGNENFFSNQFEKENTKIEKIRFIVNLMTKLPKHILEIFSVMAILSLMYYFVYFKSTSLEETLPIIAFFTLCFIRLLPTINSLSSNLPNLKSTHVSFDYINNELKNHHTNQNRQKNNKIEQFDFKEINFENVDFKYPSQNKLVLKDINLKISKNENISIIGESGSGKSTLIDLFMGLQTPNQGKILINGREINKNLNNWQNSIGYIPQSIYLQDETIEKNIAFGVPENEINKKRIQQVIKLAQLSEFVTQLTDKEYTIVGEKGARISGGQVQRIGIARALYFYPRILIFDEATSSLDNNTENKLLNEIEHLKDKYTIVTITHKSNVAKRSSKIYEIRENRLSKIS